ncbi:MAG: type VI secretion system tip protein VgrG [Proteobacteria bacterium]|nr:type VI secretion system tip protein VgrG [Pseudomonadota bacterium]
MSSTITRDHALLSMTSPLGPDVLIPTTFTCEEALGEPYLAVVEAVSMRASIDPASLLHQPVCIALRPRFEAPRHLHGLVRKVTATGGQARHAYGYRLEIVPALWFLSQTEDCRIFENKATRDILQTIFGEHRLRVSFRVQSTQPRPLTVQYNETDLAFVTRLMEEDGWFYLFQHEADAHTMVIADSNAACARLKDGAVTLRPGMGTDDLSAWESGQATALGRVSLADWDPERPSALVTGVTNTALNVPDAPNRDRFHWPARTLNRNTAEGFSRSSIEAAEVEATLSHGGGFNPDFQPGARIQVSASIGAPPADFILYRVTHHAVSESWRSSDEAVGYRNSFSAFPTGRPWRPVRRTPRPLMAGICSAEVIGPADEEIHTDALGRIKLRFRWDHRQDANPSSGVWVRVMQPWSGPRMGWSFIPRIGTEVAVAFMDGDPDRPVVVGQMHHNDQNPPLALPDQKTRSGLHTRSTPGGGFDNASELWFEDKKGAEEVFLHAERNLTVEVEHDASTTVDHDRSVVVTEGNDTHTVKQGNRTVEISRGDDKLTVSQGNRVVDVPMGNHTIQSTEGDISIKTAMGAVTVEAMQSITLKVGQSTITLDQTGVTIKGLNLQFEGTAMTTVKAPITQINAAGMMKATAGIMMLN